MSKPEARYPPAPELQGELLLTVFTHPSLRQEGGGSSDNERYSVLGQAVLEASMTHCVFLCHPHFRRDEIEEERARQLTDQNIEQWTQHYRFRDKLRYNASAYEEVYSPQGTRELFHAYVGGVYSQVNGPSTVNVWIYKLVVPPQDRFKVPEGHPSVSYLTQPPPPSVPYPMPPPPPPLSLRGGAPSSRSRANSFASEKSVAMAVDEPIKGVSRPPARTYLPKFNEVCTRRRFSVEWPAEQTGPQHLPRWVVKCVVDGREVGMGTATTKQLAKEEAAKQAFDVMNLELP